MLRFLNLQVGFALLFCAASVWAVDYIPDVYQDEYVTVRSGVMHVDQGPVHFGDILSLNIEMVFDSDEVVIENLGEELFRRSWGSEKGISLSGSPTITMTTDSEGKTVMHGAYAFQVLDCPGELTSCVGHKSYEVPIFSIGYQIVDGSGDVQNSKSIRFRPWPGKVVVTQSLHIGNIVRDGHDGHDDHEGLEEFSAYFPGGAYPSSLAVKDKDGAGLWTIFAGGVVFLAGFMHLAFSNNTPVRVDAIRRSGKRWEKVLAFLQSHATGQSDEEWADTLRRCVTWYCLDELHTNPFAWINDDSVLGKQEAATEFKVFFFELLNLEGIKPGQRDEFINRFLSLVNGDVKPA